MRKVISDGVLARLAAAQGGAVAEVASAAPLSHLVKRRPAPPPAPPAPLKVDTAGLERAAQAGQQSADALVAAVRALLGEIRAQREASPAPIRAWDFFVERDDKDRLARIRAVATR